MKSNRDYLLDTCTLSDFFRGVGNTAQKLLSASPAQIAVSSISIMEIEFGFQLNPSARKKFEEAFRELRGVIQTIPFDVDAASAAAKIRAELKNAGTPIGSFDLLIGSTALAHNRVLVTSNDKEFRRITGLVVENWRQGKMNGE